MGDARQERSSGDPLLPTRSSEDGSSPTLATLGEGLLEIGLAPDLDAAALERGFGGDAANVAVMAARMGIRAYLISHVGNDAVGRLLLRFWADAGVDISRVSVDDHAPTGLYVNERLPSGAHSFEYHRSGSAASRLSPADLDGDFLGGLDLLHVTGITLSISESGADAGRAAAEAARAGGAVIAFDVNYRRQLDAKAAEILGFAKSADIVLMAHDDAEAVIGTSAPSGVLRALGSRPSEVVITHGAGKVVLVTREATLSVEPPTVEVVNAAGAGDALAGTYLASRLGGLDPGQALARAVAAASASCLGSGCARAYPAAEEVEERADELVVVADPSTGRSALRTADG